MSLNEDKALQTRYGVTYQPVGKDGIQIAGLDGQRTTVGHHRDTLSAVLDQFSEPVVGSDAVAKLTADGLAQSAAVGAIEFLMGRGFIGDPQSTDGADPLLHLIRAVHPRAADPEENLFDRLDVPVSILGEGAVAKATAAAVADLGIATNANSKSAFEPDQPVANSNGLVIACADTDDFELFREINRTVVGSGGRAFFARLSGAQMILGPYVVPRKRPCFGCYADRVEANVAFIREFRIRTSANGRSGRALEIGEDSSVMAGMRYHIGINLAWNLLGRLNTSRQSEVHHIDLATGEIEKASLLRAPRCHVCGSGRDADPKWGPRPPMTDTLLVERLEQLLDPRIGILRWMVEGKLQPDEPPLHIAYCEFTNPLKLPPARITEEQWQSGAIEEGRQTFDVRSGALNPVGRKHATGAASDRETALWAAVGEACERYAMHLDSGHGSSMAREDELVGEVVSPDSFILFDEAQYDEVLFPFSRYDRTRPLQWRKSLKLPTMEEAWVPAQMVTGPLENNEYQVLDLLYSTGCAAGSSPAHAVAGAMREVIERDAFMFYWLSGFSPRRIDLAAAAQHLPPHLNDLLSWQGLELHALWLETDHGIPCVCTILLPEYTSGVAIGASCHLDWRQALEKATVEAFHTLNWVSDMDRWELEAPGLEGVRDFSDHVAYYRDDSRRSHLRFLTSGELVELEPTNDPLELDDHKAQIGLMVEKLSARGLNAHVINITPADLESIDLHVARVLVPGMHPIHAGTGVEHLDRRRLQAIAAERGQELPATLNLAPHPFP